MANITAVQNLLDALKAQDCMSDAEIEMCQERLNNLQHRSPDMFEQSTICAAVFNGCNSDTQIAVRSMLVSSKHGKTKEAIRGY